MLPLYLHQNTILGHLQRNRFFAIFAEQGTSKTRPMLIHILKLFLAGQIRNALVIAPGPAIGRWYEDIEKWFTPFEQRILRRIITFSTYDLIWRRPELDKQWDLICLDESHNIKNRTSNRCSGQIKTIKDPETGRKKRKRMSWGIQKISRAASYRYIMTGTPIGNSHYEEIWAQFDFLDPTIFGPYSAFEKRYCILNQFWKPWKYLHVDELKAIIAEHSYRITKAECLDLPEKLPPERYTLDLLERPMYRQMLKNYIEELDIEAKNPLARMAKLRQMCSGSILDEKHSLHRLRCEKPAALEDFLDNWDKKLVIFAEYRESIADIVRVLNKLHIRHVVLDGLQKDKGVWQQFQQDPAIQAIVCQYKTANASIDLFAADTILCYEPTLSSQTFDQACDRIHRSGQKEKCSYVLFQTAGTVEVKLWDTLMQHRDFSERELWDWIREEKAS